MSLCVAGLARAQAATRVGPPVPLPTPAIMGVGDAWGTVLGQSSLLFVAAVPTQVLRQAWRVSAVTSYLQYFTLPLATPAPSLVSTPCRPWGFVTPVP